MQITKIEIKLSSKVFVEDKQSENCNNILEEKLEKFLKYNPQVLVQKKDVLRDVDMDGNNRYGNYYNGIKINYYEGFITIDGSDKLESISIKKSLNEQIMDLVVKAASGELKNLVKSQYEFFEKELNQFVEKTEKNHLFSAPFVKKLQEIKKILTIK